jgi:hypothetical protein
MLMIGPSGTVKPALSLRVIAIPTTNKHVEIRQEVVTFRVTQKPEFLKSLVVKH